MSIKSKNAFLHNLNKIYISEENVFAGEIANMENDV